MQHYRIILKDHLGLGRQRDVTFFTLEAAEDFVNSLSREGTTCLYYVMVGQATVERYVVWSEYGRVASLEGNRRAAG